MIAARAPLRISFGGGGTDLPAYYERFGGMVVSSAITAACHVQIKRHSGRGVAIVSHDYQQSIIVLCDKTITLAEPLSLPRAVLSWFAARGLRPSGITISMRADVPPGSGLGSSSAMTAALVAAIARTVGLPLRQQQIAEIACEVEIDLLQRPIGRQDQYAAAFGGLNTITFCRSGVDVRPLRLPGSIECSLQEHVLLFSTRRTRDSAGVLRVQREASRSDEEVIQRLHAIKRIAQSMTDALQAGCLPEFGRLLDESWQLKRGLASGVSSSQIDRWYALARQLGVYGGKIAGAGGGGFFLFVLPPERRQLVTRALQKEGLTPMSVAFDHHGCTSHMEPLAIDDVDRTLKGDEAWICH
jgi:D-glycero-alpha-D-manno-heptose-7-phosphate kinase